MAILPAAEKPASGYTVKLNGNVIKRWVWTGGTQPAEERDAANNVTKRFLTHGQQNLTYNPSPLTDNLFFTTDHLGSVREMTDSTGAIRARYDYDPYGRVTKVSGDLESDFGFTGHYRHQASGLHLALYRAYDPDLGRWLSRDPLTETGPDGPNVYAYVKNNPVNHIDPDGLSIGDWIMRMFGFDPNARYSISSIGAYDDSHELLKASGMSECDFSKNLFAMAGGKLIDEGLMYLATAGVAYGTAKGYGALLDATGGLKQWVRIGPSYSHAISSTTRLSIRWGASPKYANQIGNQTLRFWNQMLRISRIELPGWRFADPGHFHIWK